MGNTIHLYGGDIEPLLELVAKLTEQFRSSTRSETDARFETLYLDFCYLVVERVPEFLGTRPEPDFSMSGMYPTLPEPNFMKKPIKFGVKSA